MPDHKNIYEEQGRLYEQLISREDYQGNILQAVLGITSLAGKEIIELGAGTGRLTCLLAPHVRSIRAFDNAQHMLDIARAKLQSSGLHNWHTEVSDHRALRAESASADIVISGWSICYLVDWNRDHWQGEVDRALAEIQRVLRPNGTIILLETMGTGFETPHPPEHLVDYYQALEAKGFHYQWIRTDYQFLSLDEACEFVQFFFGDELAAQIREASSFILSECTGIWWRQKV